MNTFYRIRYQIERPLGAIPDDDAIVEIRGTVFDVADESPPASARQVGMLVAAVLRPWIEDCSESIFHLADFDNADWGKVAAALYDPESGDLNEDLEAPSGANVLYVDRIVLEAEYRGAGLGLYVLDDVIRTFSDGCSFVAILPAPLSNAKKLTAQGRQQAKQRLARHWSQLGFKRYRRSDIFVLDTSFRRPQIPVFNEETIAKKLHKLCRRRRRRS